MGRLRSLSLNWDKIILNLPYNDAPYDKTLDMVLRTSYIMYQSKIMDQPIAASATMHRPAYKPYMQDSNCEKRGGQQETDWLGC